MTTKSKNTSATSSSMLSRRMRSFMPYAGFTLFAFMILSAYLSPFGYMVVTGIKSKDVIAEPTAPLWPAIESTFTYEGEEYEIFKVPTKDGEIHEWAMFKKVERRVNFWIQKNPEAGPITWIGRWRTLERDWQFHINWDNFTRAWR